MSYSQRLVSSFAAIASLLIAAPAATQTIYQSRGANGVPVYSDKPPTDGKVEKTLVYQYLPSSPVGAPPPVDARATSRQRTVASGTADQAIGRAVAGSVVLYGTAWCSYCRGARSYLARHGIAYQDIDIDTPSGRYAYDMAGGRAGVPLLVVGSRRVQGFSQKGYDALFANR